MMSVGVVPFSEYVLTPMEGQYLYDMSAGNNLMGQTVVGCVKNREHPHSTNTDEPTIAQEGSLWPVFSYATGTNPNSGGYSTDYSAQQPLDYNFTHDGTDLTIRYMNIYYPNHSGQTPTYHASSGDDGPAYVDGHGGLSMIWVGTAMTSIAFQNAHPWDPASYSNSHGGYGGSNTWTQGSDNGLPPSFSQDSLSETLSSTCAEYANKNLWLRPLSTNFTQMKTAIQAMRPIGLTNIALGLDLGWHMLAPDAPFTEGASGDVQKVAILLSDGVQTVSAHGAGNISSVTAANANIAKSCAAMKADNVEIFTIAFGINDQYTRDMLKNCATDDPHYFEPSAGGDLDAVFDGIFEQIVQGEVRLSG